MTTPILYIYVELYLQHKELTSSAVAPVIFEPSSSNITKVAESFPSSTITSILKLRNFDLTSKFNSIHLYIYIIFIYL